MDTNNIYQEIIEFNKMEITNKRNQKLVYYYNHREELKEKMRKNYFDNKTLLNDKHKKYY